MNNITEGMVPFDTNGNALFTVSWAHYTLSDEERETFYATGELLVKLENPWNLLSMDVVLKKNEPFFAKITPYAQIKPENDNNYYIYITDDDKALYMFSKEFNRLSSEAVNTESISGYFKFERKGDMYGIKYLGKEICECAKGTTK